MDTYGTSGEGNETDYEAHPCPNPGLGEPAPRKPSHIPSPSLAGGSQLVAACQPKIKEIAGKLAKELKGG